MPLLIALTTLGQVRRLRASFGASPSMKLVLGRWLRPVSLCRKPKNQQRLEGRTTQSAHKKASYTQQELWVALEWPAPLWPSIAWSFSWSSSVRERIRADAGPCATDPCSAESPSDNKASGKCGQRHWGSGSSPCHRCKPSWKRCTSRIAHRWKNQWANIFLKHFEAEAWLFPLVTHRSVLKI